MADRYDGGRGGREGFDRRSYNQPNALVEVHTTKRDHPMVSQTVEPKDEMNIIVYQRSEDSGVKSLEINIRPVGNGIVLELVSEGLPVEIGKEVTNQLTAKIRTSK